MVLEDTDNHYSPPPDDDDRPMKPEEIADYALTQLWRVIEIHACVRMDTEEDQLLHDQAVAVFRQAHKVGRDGLDDWRRSQ